MTTASGVVLVGLLAVAAAVVFAAVRVSGAVADARREAAVRDLLALFAPARRAVQQDPRGYLAWYPVVRSARKLFPGAFAALDGASEGAFPFSARQVADAHAQWTAEWLAWERTHDGEYALRAQTLEQELAAAGESATPVGRARMAALEREKLDRYQQRYQEYIRTARALQALQDDGAGTGSNEG